MPVRANGAHSGGLIFLLSATGLSDARSRGLAAHHRRSSSGTLGRFALHKSRSYMKACVRPPRRESVRGATRGFPGGTGLAARGANERPAHFPRPLESEPPVDRFSKV